MPSVQINSDFVPHGAQVDFYKAARYGTHDAAAFMGGWGSGKTRVLCESVWMLALMYPGGRGVLIRNTMRNLEQSTMETFFSKVLKVPVTEARSHPFVKDWNRNKMRLELKNGTIITFQSLDTQQKSGWGSLEYSFIGIDEAQECSEEQFDLISGRCRHTGEKKGQIPYQIILLAGTPAGRNWIYRRFFKEGHSDLYLGVTGTLRENLPHLPLHYERRFENMPEGQRKRFLDADFSAFEGQIFDMFSRKRHVRPVEWVTQRVQEVRASRDFVLYRTIDLGGKSPWACLWATHDRNDDVLYFEQEYIRGNLPLTAHCRNIIGLSMVRQKDGSLAEEQRHTICDTQMFQTDMTSGRTIYAQMLENGINACGCDKSVHEGVLRVQDLLWNNKVIFSERCPGLIDAIESAEWDLRSAATGKEKPKKTDKDHALDAGRYLMVSVWPLPKGREVSEEDAEEQRFRHRTLLHTGLFVPSNGPEVGWTKTYGPKVYGDKVY